MTGRTSQHEGEQFELLNRNLAFRIGGALQIRQLYSSRLDLGTGTRRRPQGWGLGGCSAASSDRAGSEGFL
jgi:hypothetical protein